MTADGQGVPEQHDSAPVKSSELGKRFISAFVLAVMALATAWLGGIAFLLIWTAAALVVWWEWTGITKATPRSLLVAIGASTLLGVALSLAMDAPAISFICAVIGAGIAAASAHPGPRRVWACAGVLYAAAALIPSAMLRSDPTFGLVGILWLFAVVWAEDAGAYFSGRLIGGPKLLPSISPNKTWAGAIGGTLASIVVGSALLHLSGIPLRPAHVFLAFLVAVAAQLGDALESWIKRRFGVKDSSALIPGHGGVMDRLDGFIVAAAVALAIGISFGGGSAPAAGLLSW